MDLVPELHRAKDNISFIRVLQKGGGTVDGLHTVYIDIETGRFSLTLLSFEELSLSCVCLPCV